MGITIVFLVTNKLHFSEFSHADQSESRAENREVPFRPFESGNSSAT